ncbi:PREDICTED: C-C motif chemokine 3-like [Acanthisitta chloris]|uniref:C-C motif chemokine 3 n=1 Tax=Acanthisitta chloris TaxID=57068 RepID=A0A091MLQ6_9PASS|nr:PREDICTED: C-C motif chemokine 3-like [Acanthisitta chloris]KFP75489.1 C-C motif chemokine 3 [Acanthisitta chloris]
MNILTATLAVLLLGTICSLAEADLDDSNIAALSQKLDMLSFPGRESHPYIPHVCCVSYVQRPIPRNTITATYRTSSHCPKPGVILVTKKGKELCANPNARWVQTYLKDLEILEH